MRAMGRTANPDWLDTLTGEANHPTRPCARKLREPAASSPTSGPLRRVAELVDDTELEVRLAAIRALGLIGGDEARETLIYALGGRAADHPRGRRECPQRDRRGRGAAGVVNPGDFSSPGLADCPERHPHRHDRGSPGLTMDRIRRDRGLKSERLRTIGRRCATIGVMPVRLALASRERLQDERRGTSVHGPRLIWVYNPRSRSDARIGRPPVSYLNVAVPTPQARSSDRYSAQPTSC